MHQALSVTVLYLTCVYSGKNFADRYQQGVWEM
jgi:hypothetical protein